MASGENSDILYVNNALITKDPYLRMDGQAVFRFAVQKLAQIAEIALTHNNIAEADLDWFIPHQANIRIINATAKKLNLAKDKIILTVDKHANTSAASIPLALDVAIRDGRIKLGDNLLFESFGGGLTWGSALVRF